MSSWKTKYRPKTFDEFAGNEEIVEAFISAISGKDKERGYLISGEYGIGKTTMARIGATQYLDADDFNITEINASSDNGINMVRTLEEMCTTATAANRIWILDEFHSATKAAQKAILKLLEEGNDKDFFFFCTTDSGSIIPMIRSRCGKFPLALPADLPIKKRLRLIAKAEGVSVAPEVTMKILEKAEGHVRDAIGFLQAVSEMEEEKALEYLDKVSAGMAESAEAYNLVKALFGGKSKTVQANLKELKASGESPESVRRFILNYGASTLLNRWTIDPAMIMENFEEPYFDAGTAWAKFVLDCYRATRTTDPPF